MNVTLIAPASVDAVWPHVSPLLLKCFEKAPGYMTPGELWQMCRSGSAYLLTVDDGEKIVGAAAWQFETAFSQDAFVCKALAGSNLNQWVTAIFETAKRMAKDGGATAIMATGRVGLHKTLKSNLSGLRVMRQTYLVEV